jgi:hypothetical protein
MWEMGMIKGHYCSNGAYYERAVWPGIFFAEKKKKKNPKKNK